MAANAATSTLLPTSRRQTGNVTALSNARPLCEMTLSGPMTQSGNVTSVDIIPFIFRSLWHDTCYHVVMSTKMTAEVHVRSQHAKHNRRGFHGPDTYVAVLIIPAGAVAPKILRRDLLADRGIEMRVIGEGYDKHRSMRSSLGRAIAEAREIAAKINQ